MTKLLVAREYVKNFYSKYEIYLWPVCKFLFAFVALTMINSTVGYMHRIESIAIVLIVALMCSFLPMGCVVVFSGLFVLLHLYALSMECALVVFMLMLVMVLLYFRFAPKDLVILLLTPLAFVLRIPYIMPLAMGLVGTPASLISVGCGTILYYFLRFINENNTTINAMEDEITAKFRYLIDGLINNKAMVVTVAAFAVTLIVVYLIRRMSIDHSWTIAMIAGSLVNIMMLLIGDLMYDTNVSIIGIMIGGIISFLLAKVLQFFVFSVDYSRTERVQFEDDEYYYYVKAIPKLNVATPAKTVKKINTQKSQSTVNQTVPRTVNTVNSTGRTRTETGHTAGTTRTAGTTHTAGTHAAGSTHQSGAAYGTGANRTTGTSYTTDERRRAAASRTTGAAADNSRPVSTVRTANTVTNRTPQRGSERSSLNRDK